MPLTLGMALISYFSAAQRGTNMWLCLCIVLCCGMMCCVVLPCVVMRNIVLCWVLLCSVLLCCEVLSCVLFCSVALCCVVFCSVVFYCIMMCCFVCHIQVIPVVCYGSLKIATPNYWMFLHPIVECTSNYWVTSNSWDLPKTYICVSVCVTQKLLEVVAMQ